MFPGMKLDAISLPQNSQSILATSKQWQEFCYEFQQTASTIQLHLTTLIHDIFIHQEVEKHLFLELEVVAFTLNLFLF